MTADEQYSYFSLWSLTAAPLFYSGDISRLDEFTLNVLCNAEVIAVDQDLLGRQARIVRQTKDEFVLAKPLADGSLAVGLFNLSNSPKDIRVSWPELGIRGELLARDLWREKDVGWVVGEFNVLVNRHGVSLVRLIERGSAH